jgi:hypothetical protein
MADERESKGDIRLGENIEIITDQNRVEQMKSENLITLYAGRTEGRLYVVKINQPDGRALLIAVHL